MQRDYYFTQEQMSNLLDATIKMFIEYRDIHGKSEESASFAAQDEIMQGLNADQDLYKQDKQPMALQSKFLPPMYGAICFSQKKGEQHKSSNQ